MTGEEPQLEKRPDAIQLPPLAKELPQPAPAITKPSPAKAVPPPAENLLVEVTDLNWEREVEKQKTPVAVMFYSPTCVFCHQMEPYFRTYAKEFKNSVLFARIDIMSNNWTAERYGVRSTPTFKFFCEGKPVREMVGAIYPAILKKQIEEVLLHGKECAKNSTAIDYDITGYG